jgi:hypothetical protein
VPGYASLSTFPPADAVALLSVESESCDGRRNDPQAICMKLLTQRSFPVLRAVLSVVLVLSLTRSVVAPGMQYRAQTLEALRARSSAIATRDISGIIFSGAARPSDILTSYLVAAGYIRCLRVCSPTAKGRAQHWVTKPLLGDLVQITVPLADLTVDAVTDIHRGIADIAAGQTIVDFSYSVKPNALARAMLAWAGSRRFCGVDYATRWKRALPGRAAFIKDDGGWRLAGAPSTREDSNPFGVACAMP